MCHFLRNYENSVFRSPTKLARSVPFLEQTTFSSIQNTNQPVFVTEKQCVRCEVGLRFLNINKIPGLNVSIT